MTRGQRLAHTAVDEVKEVIRGNFAAWCAGGKSDAGEYRADRWCEEALVRLLTWAAQNVNLSAACIRRGGAALTTWPNKALSMSPFTAAGPKKFV